MSRQLDTILESLAEHEVRLRSVREILLANALMIGEIPAPTFHEEARIQFLSNRFTESALQHVSIDEAGNVLGMIPGTKGKKNILVLAHADTVFHEKIDHAMSVGPNTITGPGIGDNSLGLAAIATLPHILDRLGLQFEDNLILMGATRSMGHGDLGGLRFFLNNNKKPIHAGLVVEGIHLGRLSYASVGLLRAEIVLTVPAVYDWTKFGASGAISILSKIIYRIQQIPIPAEPKTRILFGSINAGTSFSTQPTSAILRFEVRSEQEGMVAKLKTRIESIIDEIANESDTQIELSVIAQRKSGGIPYEHPLVRNMRSILKQLQIKPTIAPSTGSIGLLLANGIPSVTLGLTRGKHRAEFDESIEIEPVFSGLAQLVALLQSIDGGWDDER